MKERVMATIDTVYQEAINMKPAEKIELIDRLMLSLDHPDKEIDALWKEEAESRLKAYDAGEIGSTAAKEVFAKYGR